MMKSISIVGNLGANAVRRVTAEGKELMTFSVAVNDAQNRVTWFNCVSGMRKNFDYLVKGQCVAVTGDLTIALYNGNLDASVNVDRLELCGARNDAQQMQQSATNDSEAHS